MREISYNKKKECSIRNVERNHFGYAPKSSLMSQAPFYLNSKVNTKINRRRIMQKKQLSLLVINTTSILVKEQRPRPTIEHSLHISITNHDTNYNDILSHFVKIVACHKYKTMIKCIQMREISYNKKEHSILSCWMVPIFFDFT